MSSEQKGTFKERIARLSPYIKPYWVRGLLGLLLTIPSGAFDSITALMLRPYMDNIMVIKDIKYSLYIPIAIVLFTIVQGVVNYLAAYLNSWTGYKMTVGLKADLYRKLLTQDSSYFDANHSGTILQRYSADADTACASLVAHVRLFMQRFFSSFFLIGVLFYNSWQLALIAIVALLAAFLPLSIVRRKMKEYTAKNVINTSRITTEYNETFSGNRTIASYNLQEHQNKHFGKALDNLFAVHMKIVNHTRWISPVMHVIMAIGVALVIGAGSFLIINESITTGAFVSFIAALVMLYNPIKSIGNNYVNVQNSLLAIDRIFEIMDEQPKIIENENAKTLTKVASKISFEKVNFSYDGKRKVLKNISFEALVGEQVALVGNSGGGKSTLVNLIPRFYDVSSGHIKIDGIDIKDFKLSSLRGKISVVFQDNFLFSGTIRENIMIGNPKATAKELRDSLKNAHLTDFISSLPKGLDTVLGERGITLSGGQRQRVAIARAFIKNAPIVILDEATSALDNKSEAVVQKALDNLMKNRTVFVIAHRLSTIVRADKILVINDGEIVESGSHEKLLKKNGAYKSLYNAQFKPGKK